MEFMKKVLQGRKGFTLIEVMIALVLFAVGLMAYAGLEVLALRNMTYSKDYAKANNYAQQLIEQCKGSPFDNLPGLGATVGRISTSLEGGKYTRTLVVTQTEEIKQVKVTVTWADSAYGSKTISLYTELYKNPSIG